MLEHIVYKASENILSLINLLEK